MATNRANVFAGKSTVLSIGDYVAAGGAGSLVDVGHIKGPVELAVTFEDYELESDQSFGVFLHHPLKAKVTVKAALQEATAEHFRIAMRQPAANKTGTTPNFSVLVGNPVQQYHQAQFVGKGAGTGNVRTVTLWRARVESVSPVSFGKSPEQVYEIVFNCEWDESLATADKFLKQVDS